MKNILNYFISSILYFKRLKEIGKKFEITILPKDIEKINNEDLFIERIYFSLIEEKPIRSNDKIISMSNASLPQEMIKKKGPMLATCREEVSFLLLENKIPVHMANIIFNLVINREEIEDNKPLVYFRDDENNPMYTVSRMFLDEKDAIEELKQATNQDNINIYKNAKTLYDYIEEAHENFCK